MKDYKNVFLLSVDNNITFEPVSKFKIESFLCAMIMIKRSKYLTKTFIEINGILDTDRWY